jgi:hypothetical protein
MERACHAEYGAGYCKLQHVCLETWAFRVLNFLCWLFKFLHSNVEDLDVDSFMRHNTSFMRHNTSFNFVNFFPANRVRI